jgi:DEAD/DEAH box helicase domain-containing protein
MMRYVVFDLETQNTFHDVGSNEPADLDISVGSAYDSGTDTYTTVTIDEIHKLWPIFEQAEVLVGYNSDHFDIPLLNKYYPGNLAQIKSIDLMAAIQQSLGRRIRLDDVAQATLGMRKSAHGLMAIKWWREGDIDSIKKYCVQDVKVTKKLFEYMREHKKVLLKDAGKKREIPIDTSSWEPHQDHSMTFSLPF